MLFQRGRLLYWHNISVSVTVLSFEFMCERDSKTERIKFYIVLAFALVDSSLNVMAHGDAQEGK